MSMTPAQTRMLETLRHLSARELARHPGSGGYVEIWEVYDAWGRHVPLGLLPNAATRAWSGLSSHVEEHPEFRELVRPRPSACR